MITTQTETARTPTPVLWTASWFWQQTLWQQQMYQWAYARAWSAIYGPQPVRVRPAELPRVLRN